MTPSSYQSSGPHRADENEKEMFCIKKEIKAFKQSQNRDESWKNTELMKGTLMMGMVEGVLGN